MERLSKVIATSGIASRRKAEELIDNGFVKVNGKVVREQGVKVDSSDIIEVNNRILKKELKEYYLLYKPRGIVTTTNDEKGRKTVVDLIKTGKRIYPVGEMFNPDFHEAISQIESDMESGMVVDVLQAGYSLNDRVIKPALVIVAK